MYKYDVGETLAYINEYNIFIGYKVITSKDQWADNPRYYISPTDAPWFPVAEDNLHKYHTGYYNGIITDDVLKFIDKYDADWLIEVISYKIKQPLDDGKVLPVGKVNIISFNNDVMVNLVTWTGKLVSLEAFYDKDFPDGNWTLCYDNSIIYF